MLFARRFALNRHNVSDPEDRQDIVLQELAKFSLPTNNQYGIAVLRHHHLALPGQIFLLAVSMSIPISEIKLFSAQSPRAFSLSAVNIFEKPKPAAL